MSATSTAKDRVGVVGLGRMGANMARRLKDVGYPVTAVYDVRPEVSKELATELGAEAAPALARVTELSDVIITVVTDDAAMRSIFATSGDSLLTNARGKIFINSATVTPNVHVEVQQLAEDRGAQSLEASLASSIPQAREGTLYMMVAGRRETFERVEPMLRQMSKKLRYIGDAGQAAKVKALVNMVMNINTAGLAEGLGLGEALGLDLTVLREVFAETGANSRVLETDGLDMENREHDVYFSAAHAAKDSHIATALAEDKGLSLPLAEATAKQYDTMIEQGLGEIDKSGVAELTFASRRAKTRSKA
ncbi:MAG: 3-hydroxyisobutyrate dehydrogenase [Candidatus Eremiobacteraeota bacterium]|jgi:3-hydroxyisobutyrate dehydrogenase|nr:3-hydroxyisobutyrate dehydrogenase [Candidatus Eremiobacteraeota bacterium]